MLRRFIKRTRSKGKADKSKTQNSDETTKERKSKKAVPPMFAVTGDYKTDKDIFTFDQRQLMFTFYDGDKDLLERNEHLRQPIYFPPGHHHRLPRTSLEKQRLEVSHLIKSTKRRPTQTLLERTSLPSDFSSNRRTTLLQESKHTGSIKHESFVKQRIYDNLLASGSPNINKYSRRSREMIHKRSDGSFCHSDETCLV